MRFKIQHDKCSAILSIGIQKSHLMRDKETLMPLLHSNILSLAVLETLCDESDDLKNLEQRSTCLVHDLLLEIRREITVGIFQNDVLVMFPCFNIPTFSVNNFSPQKPKTEISDFDRNLFLLSKPFLYNFF